MVQKVRKATIMRPCWDTIHHLVGHTVGKCSTRLKGAILNRLDHIQSHVVRSLNRITSVFSHVTPHCQRNNVMSCEVTVTQLL